MAQWGFWRRQGVMAPDVLQQTTQTLDGTGTETTFTFASHSLKKMATTSYYVFLNPNDAAATPLNVKVNTKATTGFTIQHPNNSTITVDVLIIGEPDLNS